jgi:hypothetical protein
MSMVTTTTTKPKLVVGRAIWAVAQPCTFQIDRPEVEGRILRDALQGLHAIVARQQQQHEQQQPIIHASVGLAICTLLERADGLALDPLLSLKDVCEMRWAARGIQTRILHHFDTMKREDNDDSSTTTTTMSHFELRQRFQEFLVASIGIL